MDFTIKKTLHRKFYKNVLNTKGRLPIILMLIGSVSDPG